MRVWSKLAIALAAGSWIVSAPPCYSQDKAPAPAAKPEKPTAEVEQVKGEEVEKEDAPSKGPSVELRLVIGGLSREGCEVEVKAGNAACRFKKQTRHVASDGKLTFVFKDVEIRSVDRNCTFAITLHEPGQDPKTVRRGFRMSAESDGPRKGPESFTCFMSSPSKIAGLEREGRVIR